MSFEPKRLMHSIIERIATGPELSKSISEEEAYQGMMAILNDDIDEVQAALFLIALRMKRETPQENRGVMRALLETAQKVAVDCEELLDIGDAFNGFSRCVPMSPFLPPILAACDMPCLSTGVETVAPKFGVTTHQILRQLTKSIQLTPEQAAAQIANPSIGWAYLDQSLTNPQLHRLLDLRRLMVKRSCLSTCEVMLRPLMAQKRNIIYVGYVHKNYPPIYADLASCAGYAQALIIKGVEGGVIPSLQAGAKLYLCSEQLEPEVFSVNPQDFGINSGDQRAIPRQSDSNQTTVAQAAELGLAALSGDRGMARDSLIYAASIALVYSGRFLSPIEASVRAGQAIDSGDAMRRFENAL